MKITLNRKKIYLEVFLQHINKIRLRLFYCLLCRSCCGRCFCFNYVHFLVFFVLSYLSLPTLVPCCCWNCIDFCCCFRQFSFLILVPCCRWYYFVEVSISFHFLVWCMKLLLLPLTLRLGLVHCRCCSCHLLLLSFFVFNKFSLLGLMHEGVEGVVKGVHKVGVVDWRLSAWEIDI